MNRESFLMSLMLLGSFTEGMEDTYLGFTWYTYNGVIVGLSAMSIKYHGRSYPYSDSSILLEQIAKRLDRQDGVSE